MHKYLLFYTAIMIYVFTLTSPINSQSYKAIEDRIFNLESVSEDERYDSVRAIIDGFVSFDMEFEKEQYRKIMEMSSKWSNKKSYIVALMGNANYDRDNSLEYLSSAYKLAEENDYQNLMGEVLYVKVMLLREFEMYDSLTVNLIKAINIYDKLGLSEKKTGIMHSLADLYYSVGLYDKAEELYKKILKMKGDEVVWDAWRHKVIINNLALVEMERGNYENAINYLYKSLDLNYKKGKTQRTTISSGYIEQLIARSYYNLGNLDSTWTYYNLSFPKCYKNEMKSELVHLYNLKSKIYFEQGEIDSCLAYCNKVGEIISAKGGTSTGILHCYDLYSKAYSKLGNYRQAYYYRDKYASLSDSLLSQSNTVANMQLLAENNYNKVASNLELVRKDNLYLTAAVIVTFIFIFVVVLIYIKLRTAHKSLLEKDREKTELMRLVTHNLKNPIGVIRNANELISESYEEKELVTEMSGVVEEASAHMLESVTQLLLSSQIEDSLFLLNETKFDLIDAINKVIEDNEVLLNNKSQKLERDLPTDKKIIVKADYDKISAAMDNYISNAVKYSPLNSIITIKVTLRKNDVLFSVFDNGPGLSPKDIGMAFGKFVKLSPRPTGNESSTGLGLSIVKKIIELHKGKVGVNSEVNKGSEFYFSIPIFELMS